MTRGYVASNNGYSWYTEFSVSGPAGSVSTPSGAWRNFSATASTASYTWTSAAGKAAGTYTLTANDRNAVNGGTNPPAKTTTMVLGPCIAQTITGTTTPDAPIRITLGNTVAVTLAGGNTPYAYSGPASVNVTGSASSGDYTITPTAVGTFTVQFYATEANGYCQSGTFPVTMEVGEPQYCIEVQVSGPIYSDTTGKRGTVYHYRLKKGEEVLNRVAVNEADTPTEGGQYRRNVEVLTAMNLATDEPVSLELYVAYAYKWNTDTQTWVYAGAGDEEWGAVQTITPKPCNTSGPVGGGGGGGGDDDPPPTVTPGEGGVVSPPPPKSTGGSDGEGDGQQPPTEGPKTGGNKGGGSVWQSQGGGGGLDNDTYMEGTGKLEEQLVELNETLKQIRDQPAPTVEVTVEPDPNSAAITQAAADGAAATDGEGNGDGSGAASSEMRGAFADGPANPSLSMPSGSRSGLRLTVAGFTLSADPADDPQISALADFIKQACVWIFSIVFAWWCWGEFARICQQVMSAQQAKGNPVVAGTGAQATALVAAGAITAILVAVPVAYWAFATYDIQPIGSVSGPGSVALYYLFFFFPVSALLGFVAGAFVVRKAGVVLVAGTSTLIRFVVP